MGSALLEITHLSKRFGGIQAVEDVSLTIPEHRVFAIIGPNGSGKTTIFNLISGMIPTDEGDVRFRGESLSGKSPVSVAALGIIRTYQNVRVFKNMTVAENVMAGFYVRTRSSATSAIFTTPSVRRERRWVKDRTTTLLQEWGLLHAASTRAGALPYGDQRRVEIVRALAAEPVVLMLDEPAAGLNNAESEQLVELLQRLRDRSITVILIEHDMRVIRQMSDIIAVLNFGKCITVGTPEEVMNNPLVIEAYLGTKGRGGLVGR